MRDHRTARVIGQEVTLGAPLLAAEAQETGPFRFRLLLLTLWSLAQGACGFGFKFLCPHLDRKAGESGKDAAPTA